MDVATKNRLYRDFQKAVAEAAREHPGRSVEELASSIAKRCLGKVSTVAHNQKQEAHLFPKPGEMLTTLESMLRQEVRPLMDRLNPNDWESLRITYETPHVDRLYRQVGDFRICLHHIHPCEKPFAHTHPWPSAALVLAGQYEMGVGYGDQRGDPWFPGMVPPEVARLFLTEGSRFEMTHPEGWHYVKPHRSSVYSIMVMGKPWPQPASGEYVTHAKPERVAVDDNTKREMLWQFSTLLRDGWYI